MFLETATQMSNFGPLAFWVFFNEKDTHFSHSVVLSVDQVMFNQYPEHFS